MSGRVDTNEPEEYKRPPRVHRLLLAMHVKSGGKLDRRLLFTARVEAEELGGISEMTCIARARRDIEFAMAFVHLVAWSTSVPEAADD